MAIMSREEQIELAERAQHGDVEARNRLVMENRRLVCLIARRLVPSRLIEDMVQSGCLVMLESVQRFDCRRGIAFASYAGRSAQLRMLRELNHEQVHQRYTNGGGSSSLQVAADDDSPDVCAIKQEQATAVRDAVSKLPHTWQVVARCLMEGKSLVVAADRLGVSSERARQIKIKVAKRLAELFSGDET